MARAGLVFIPEWQHPIYVLAMIQQMLGQNLLYQVPREHLDKAVGPARHFGDATQWHHVAELFELFDFGVDEDHIDASWSVVLSLAKGLSSVFAQDGGLRVWMAIWDAVHAGYRIQMDKSEPVATLLRVEDEPGLDEWVPQYDLWMLKALESRVNMQAAMQYTAYAVHLPEAHDVRVTADGFMSILNSASSGQLDPSGSPLTPLSGSIAAQILPRSPWLGEATAEQLIGSPTGQGRAWADGLLEMMRAMPMPIYPLEGYTTAQLHQLAPIQRHGAPRQGYTHSGLDLPGPSQTPIRAMWAGEVKAVQRGEMPRTRPNEDTDARGNFVILEHTFKSGGQHYRVTTEYYHLHSVPDKLASGVALKRGAEVKAGEVIGLLGSTGNSTGPHLHLDVRVGLVDESKRSVRKWTLDPQVILENGLLAAMRAAGVPTNATGAPHLAVPAMALSSIVSGKHRVAAGMPRSLLREYEAQTRAFYDGLKKQATEAAQAAVSAASSVVKQVEPVAKKIGAAGFDAFAPGTSGRAALEMAYTSVGLPGGLMGGVLDALHAAYDGAAGTGDARRTSALEGLDQRLAGQELTEEQRAQLLALANRAYSQIKS